ncbi:MAG: NAD(P)-dependent oxidoreductase [Henriciella sp.]|nr:NAD(P)-dependent oxidoreductase [Henriciella sp.]
MKHLLLHTNTFARIEDALKPFADVISPLVVDDHGEIQHPWGKVETSALIAYATPDAFFSPSVMTFIQTLMGYERLEWVQSSAAGLEHPVLQSIGSKAEHYTASHEQADAIAEWVLWAGFDFFQKGRERRKAQAGSEWRRIPFREISDTHWLIFGFGAIGQATARRLRALGAQVTGVRRTPGAHEHADQMITPDRLLDTLGQCDAVLLSAPHTPETDSVADAGFFAAMKPGSLLVNVGRGALVDEPALLAALESDRPGHAALDVLREEPQPADSPFWHHPKVTLTAHISAATAQAMIRTDKVFLNNLPRFLAGQEMINLIPKSAFK